MKPLLLTLVFLILTLVSPLTARAQGTAFTYQGFLTENGGPANSANDFEFKLYNAASAGTQQGSTVTLGDVGVTNGLFTVALDFGSAPFNGGALWLDIAVRPGASAGAHTNLLPRQPITTTPYASYARAANQLTTTGSQPLHFSINGLNVMRITSVYDPTSGSYVANSVGGYSGNIISNGFVGGYIGGGGNAVAPNQVGGNYASVVGGWANTASGDSSTAMGTGTTASGVNSTAMGSLTIASGGGSTAMGQQTVASGANSLAAGQSSVASGATSAALGYATTAGGDGSTAMGYLTTAAGLSSTALGYRSKANHRGGFVWADSVNADFASTTNDQFLVRAGGGVGINTNNPNGAALAVHGNVTVRGNLSVSGSNTFNGTQTFTGGVAIVAPNTNSPALTIGGDTYQEGVLYANGVSAAGVTTTEMNASAGVLDFKVNGHRALRLEYANDPANGVAPNITGGYAGNLMSNGIAGGFIGGGGNSNFPNRVGGYYASVVGGSGNVASDLNSTAMGELTSASARASTAMGFQTTASKYASTAMGAETKAIGDASTAMGYSTTASGEVSTAMGLYSVASGYSSFAAGESCIASNLAAVAMGYQTFAGGPGSTALGVFSKANHNNTFVWADGTNPSFGSSSNNQFLINATGGVGIGTTSPARLLQLGDAGVLNSEGMMRFASRSGTGPSARQWDIGVPEGDQDVAGKYYSFVIDDTQNGSDPEFLIRWDTGNVGINQTNPVNKLDVVGGTSGNAIQAIGKSGGSAIYGENLTGGGYGIAGRASGSGLAVYGDNVNASGWAGYFNGNVRITGTLNPPSDRNVKRDFATVDAREVLEKLAALSIQTWAYTNDTRGSRHLGPVAQDFKAAFGLGADDTSIATVDADGVALAAIQGLNQKLEEQKAENAELKRELAEIKKLLKALNR